MMVICLLALVVAVAAPAPGIAAAAQKKVAKVGVIIAHSGAMVSASLPTVRALQLTAERINMAGGINLGDHKVPLELVFVDAKSDPQRAVALMRRLAKDPSVLAVIGPNDNLTVAALQAEMSRLDLPLVNPSVAAIPESAVPTETRVFSIGLAAERYYELAMAAAIGQQSHGGPARLGIIYENDNFGVAALKGVMRQSEKIGLPLVYEQVIASSRDLDTAPQRLEQRHPSVLIVAVNTPSLSRDVLRLIARHRIDFDMLVFSACDVAQLTSLGSMADYILCPVQWDGLAEQEDPYWGNAATFFATYEVSFGSEPTYHAAQAEAALTVIVKALERASVLDRLKLREALLETDQDTVFGPIRFGPDGRNSTAEALLDQIRGGNPMTVLPYDRAWVPLIDTMPAWKDRLP